MTYLRPTVFALLALAAVLVSVSNDGARAAYNVSDPIPGTLDSVDIDVDTTGNTATSVDSVQTAISVPMPEYPAASIVSSSVSFQSVITTAAAHGLTTGDWVLIAGHSGSTPDINGRYVVTVISTTKFSIPRQVTVGGTGGTATKQTTHVVDIVVDEVPPFV